MRLRLNGEKEEKNPLCELNAQQLSLRWCVMYVCSVSIQHSKSLQTQINTIGKAQSKKEKKKKDWKGTSPLDELNRCENFDFPREQTISMLLA